MNVIVYKSCLIDTYNNKLIIQIENVSDDNILKNYKEGSKLSAVGEIYYESNIYIDINIKICKFIINLYKINYFSLQMKNYALYLMSRNI